VRDREQHGIVRELIPELQARGVPFPYLIEDGVFRLADE
jgi:hypothetical protein